MSCPDETDLFEFALGLRPAASREQLEHHVDACASCARLLAEFVKVCSTQHTDRGADEASELPEVGDLLGRYVLLHRIGTGGMGIVYAAYDTELDRKVALKLVRRGVGEAGTARMNALREARAAATLSHDNVVPVYDVGSDRGQIFLAMELVDGLPLSSWLAVKRRSLREILKIFLAAGRGLAALHEAGLVHRDFKPHNVLIGRDDRVRVTDFGLARPLGEDGGGSREGTPAYMPPEQDRGEPADPRADQYSFCASLHGALHGRSGEPPTQVRHVPRWLDAAIAKGLAVNADDRHADMGALLSALERGVRTAGRLRIGWALAVASAISLVAGGLSIHALRAEPGPRCELLAGGWDPGSRAGVERAFSTTKAPYAADIFRRVDVLVTGYSQQLLDARSRACERASDPTESGELRDRRTTCLARRRQELDALIAELSHADATAVAKAVEAVTSLPTVSPCDDATYLLAKIAPPSSAEAAGVDAVRAQIAEASAKQRLGHSIDALAVVERAIQAARRVGYRPALADAIWKRGAIEHGLGELAKAENTLMEALWMAEAAGDDFAVSAIAAQLVGTSTKLEHVQDSERWLQLASAVATRIGRVDTGLASALEHARADAAIARGEPATALECLRRALTLAEANRGAESYEAGVLRITIGKLLAEYLDRGDEAVVEISNGLSSLVSALGPQHPDVGLAQMLLANGLLAAGRFDEALDRLDEALVIAEATHQSRTSIGDIAMAKANGFSGLERFDDAIVAYEQALDAYRESLGPDHIIVAVGLANLAATLRDAGRIQDAVETARTAVRIAETRPQRDETILAEIRIQAAAVYLEGALPREAEALASRALAIHTDTTETGRGSEVEAWIVLGRARAELGKHRQGLTDLERALELAEARHDRPCCVVAQARFELARASWSAGEAGERARSLAISARDLFAAGRAKLWKTKVDQWLAAHGPPTTRR